MIFKIDLAVTPRYKTHKWAGTIGHIVAMRFGDKRTQFKVAWVPGKNTWENYTDIKPAAVRVIKHRTLGKSPHKKRGGAKGGKFKAPPHCTLVTRK